MALKFAGLAKGTKASKLTSDRTLVSPFELRHPVFRVVYWLVLMLLFLSTLTTLFPLYWLFTGALKDLPELAKMPPDWVPLNPHWNNYFKAWDNLNFPRYFLNSALIAFGNWLFQLLIACSAAYSLSKLKPAFGKFWLFMFISTLMVPAVTYFIPQYVTVVDLPLLHWRLVDTWWAIWLPGCVNGFNIFLLKSFFFTCSTSSRLA